MAKTAPKGKSGGSVFTRKIGPLPGWVWVGGGVGALILFSYSKKSQGSVTDPNVASSQALAAADYVSASKATNPGTTTQSPDALTTFLAGLVSGANLNPAATTPGNSGASVTTPGSTGNPVVQQPVSQAQPAAPQAQTVAVPSATPPGTAPYSPNPATPVALTEGTALPQATGQANYYVNPDGTHFVYG